MVFYTIKNQISSRLWMIRSEILKVLYEMRPKIFSSTFHCFLLPSVIFFDFENWKHPKKKEINICHSEPQNHKSFSNFQFSRIFLMPFIGFSGFYFLDKSYIIIFPCTWKFKILLSVCTLQMKFPIWKKKVDFAERKVLILNSSVNNLQRFIRPSINQSLAVI